MGSKFAVSYEEQRIDAVEKYLRYEYSMNDLSKQLMVANISIRRWLARYQSLGPEGLQETSKNLPYSMLVRKMRNQS